MLRPSAARAQESISEVEVWQGVDAGLAGEDLAARIDEMLHSLCQPLTVLQCRLALGEMDGGPAAMRSAIGDALSECVRLNATVGAMREMLIAAQGHGEQ